jgi:putative phosphoesterase
MSDSRRGRRSASWPSEASFVLRQQADAIILPASDRRRGPSVSASGASKSSSPFTGPESSTWRASRGAARAAHASVPARGDDGILAKSASPKGASRPAPVDTRIGVISDNHGYLDPAILGIFAGVTHIIHAGDICDPDILTALKQVAPVTAVAGNADAGELAAGLPREVAGQVAGVRFVLGHKRKRLLKSLVAGTIEGDLEGAAPHLVVFGHEHVPTAAWVEGTLFLNPGSASAPNEEDDWPTVAIVSVRPAGLAVCFRSNADTRMWPGRPRQMPVERTRTRKEGSSRRMPSSCTRCSPRPSR